MMRGVGKKPYMGDCTRNQHPSIVVNTHLKQDSSWECLRQLNAKLYSGARFGV